MRRRGENGELSKVVSQMLYGPGGIAGGMFGLERWCDR